MVTVKNNEVLAVTVTPIEGDTCSTCKDNMKEFSELVYYILKWPIIITGLHYLGKFYIWAYCSICNYDIPDGWGWNDFSFLFIAQIVAGALISGIMFSVCCINCK